MTSIVEELQYQLQREHVMRHLLCTTTTLHIYRNKTVVCNFVQCMDQGHLDDQQQAVRVYKTIYINSN